MRWKFGTRPFSSTSEIEFPDQPMWSVSPTTVSCTLCWASVAEGLYEAHWKWHLGQGHVNVDSTTQPDADG